MPAVIVTKNWFRQSFLAIAVAGFAFNLFVDLSAFRENRDSDRNGEQVARSYEALLHTHILTELLSPPNDPIEFRSDINSSEFIDEIQPDLWESALANPPAYADWIMVGLQDDTVGKRIASYPNFDLLYQVVFRNEIVTIYHKVNP